MVLVRVIVGLVKGAIIGGLVGYGLYRGGLGSGAIAYLGYALIGFAAGLLCGRPIWSHLIDKQSTVVTPILKGIVGAGVAIGLYAVVARALHGGPSIPALAPAIGADGHETLSGAPAILGAVIGALYGLFVEIDDGGSPKALPAAKK